MSAPTYQTRKIIGTVVDSKKGTAQMKSEIVRGKGLEVVRSNHFNRMPDGTEVECLFRIRTDGEYQLISASVIDPMARYQVVLTDMPDDDENIERLDNLLRTEFDATDREVHDVFSQLAEDVPAESDSDDLSGIAIVSPALTAIEAHEVADFFGSQIPEASFTVMKVNSSKRNNFARESSGDVDLSGQIKVLIPAPEIIDGHWLTVEERGNFGVIRNVMDAGGHINVSLLGPSGFGKTDKGQALANYLDCDCVVMDCSVILDTESWFGQPEARDGTTYFDASPFTEAIERGNCVVILDEANRIEPQLANSLFPILDHRRRTTVHGRDIQVGPSVVFLMTFNIGIKYAGTHVTDGAFRNRTNMTWKVGPMPQRQESRRIARAFGLPEDSRPVMEIVAMVTELRKAAEKHELDVDVSTRVSLNLALLVVNGMSIEQACRYAIVESANDEEQKVLLDTINITLRTLRP